MKKSFILLLLASFSLFSCVEDEGNYTYTKMNQITIEGVGGSYNVLDKVDTIRISPTVTGSVFKDNLENYEFQWHIHEGVAEHKHTIISHEKDLEYWVNLGIGDFTLYFTVKDKTTGLEASSYAAIRTSTATSKGFLLLGDDIEEGIMGLDMIGMPAGRDTSVAKKVYDNSETRFKGANKIIYPGARSIAPDKEEIWMCSDDGSFRVDHKTGIFSIISEVNDYHMIETEFEHKKLRILDMFPHQFNNYGRNWNCSYSNRGYMTEDMLFVGAVSTAEYYATPCNRTSATATELFNFFPFVFYNEASNNGYTNTFVIYNTDENRFMKTYWNLQRASHCVAPGSDYSTDYFPWDQTGTGRTLVWGGNGLDTGGHSYALMKDTDGQYFLYKFVAGPYSFTKKGCYTIDLSVAQNFANASYYMVSATGTIMLYACGSKLCMYNYAYNTYQEYDMGAEITCLEAEFVSAQSRTAFMVATYSDSEKGIVRKMDVGTNPNVLEIIERPNEVWNTNLRVKDIEWKSN